MTTTRPGQPMDRDLALRLSIMIEKRARADANAWRASLPRRAQLVARGRAGQVIDPTATSTDPLRTHIMQEWYVRVFEDQLRATLGLLKPTLAVTVTETEHVAECLHQGVAFKILGPGGSVVLNPESDQVTPGQSNFITGESDGQGQAGEAKDDDWHRQEAAKLADQLEQRRQDEEQLISGVWNNLTTEQRADFAAYWHQLHHTTGPTAWPQTADAASPQNTPTRAEQEATPSTVDSGQREPIAGIDRNAAAAVFDHTPPNVAELNAARELAAQDFPRREHKPPKLNNRGTERHGTFMPQPLVEQPAHHNKPDLDSGR